MPFPHDVLVVVLDKTDMCTLMTARLVCKAFRRASIPCVKSLDVTLGGDSTADSTVVPRLKVFSFVTHLKISVDIGNVQALTFPPADLSSLCRLRVTGLPDAKPTPRYLEELAAAFRAATGLTALELNHPSLLGAARARVLSACSILRKLRFCEGGWHQATSTGLMWQRLS
jgi:hypothetical protein